MLRDHTTLLHYLYKTLTFLYLTDTWLENVIIINVSQWVNLLMFGPFALVYNNYTPKMPFIDLGIVSFINYLITSRYASIRQKQLIEITKVFSRHIGLRSSNIIKDDPRYQSSNILTKPTTGQFPSGQTSAHIGVIRIIWTPLDCISKLLRLVSYHKGFYIGFSRILEI